MGAVFGPPSAFGACADFDEQSLALREYASFLIDDARFGPMFSRLVANHAALDTNWRSTGNRQEVVDLHLARHRCAALGADRLAHGFIEQRSDNAAVQIAGMAVECAGNDGKAHDGTVVGEQEFETQPISICLSTAEAAVIGRMGKGCEVFVALGHAGLTD